SRSPPMIFMKVDLPEPLAPIRPYRLPSPNLTLTFSKRGLGPNWIVRLAVEITAVELEAGASDRRMGKPGSLAARGPTPRMMSRAAGARAPKTGTGYHQAPGNCQITPGTV